MKDGRAAGEGDALAICLLLLLYTLQGIPMGLSGSVPFLMQARGVGMAEQARFSTVSYPFSLKLLWAPLVDSLYVARFGRRKTWIVPAQLAIGLLLIAAGGRIGELLGDAPDVPSLTALFFVFYALAATQDIAVDGLALTILSEKNRELGATCNAIGQNVGYALAYTVFLALNDAHFCNAYLRPAEAASEAGMVSLGGFMGFWGWVFLLSTLCVLFVRRDEHHTQPGPAIGQLRAAYAEMVAVLQLPAVRSIGLVLLTAKVPFAVFDAVAPLRLVESGVPSANLAMLASLVLPVTMAAQALVSWRYFSRPDPKPMSLWLGAYPARLALGAAAWGLVRLCAAAASGPAGELPAWLYGLMLLFTVAGTAISAAMFVAQMAFFNRVSDPALGGTYMTMLNTLANLGGMWPATAALALVGRASLTTCVPDGDCVADGGAPCPCTDVTLVDGFTAVSALSIGLGVAWLIAMRRRIRAVEALPASAWIAGGAASGHAE